MKTLQLVSRDGTTVSVTVDENVPLLSQIVLSEGMIAMYDGSRLLPEDSFISREMTNKDYVDLMEHHN